MLESILNSAAQKQQHWSTHKHPAVRTTPGKKAVASSDTSRQLQWQQHKCNRKYLPCLFFTKWDCCHYDKTRAIYLKFPFLERYQQFIKYKIFLVTTCALQNNSSHNLLINSNKFSTGGNLAQLDRIDLTIPIFDN